MSRQASASSASTSQTNLNPEAQATKYISDKIAEVCNNNKTLAIQMNRDFQYAKGIKFSTEVPASIRSELVKTKKKHANERDEEIAAFKKIKEQFSVIKEEKNDQWIANVDKALTGIIGYLENFKKIIAEQGVESKGSLGSRIKSVFLRKPSEPSSSVTHGSAAAASSSVGIIGRNNSDSRQL